MEYVKINDIAKKGVLALATESVGTSNFNRVPNYGLLDYQINEALSQKRRVIFSLYSASVSNSETSAANSSSNSGSSFTLISFTLHLNTAGHPASSYPKRALLLCLYRLSGQKGKLILWDCCSRFLQLQSRSCGKRVSLPLRSLNLQWAVPLLQIRTGTAPIL